MILSWMYHPQTFPLPAGVTLPRKLCKGDTTKQGPEVLKWDGKRGGMISSSDQICSSVLGRDPAILGYSPTPRSVLFLKSLFFAA